MTVPSAAAWIGVPQAAARSMPVWNIGRPRSGWMRGPKGEVSPPGTGWMNSGRPMIGAAMAWAVAGARLIAGNMKRPPPMAALNAESTGARATVGEPVTDPVSSLRAWPTTAMASWTAAGEPAASTTEAVGVWGVLPPRNGSRANNRSRVAKGTKRPLILMFRTNGPLRSLASVTVKPPPRGTPAVTIDTLPTGEPPQPEGPHERPHVLTGRSRPP